MDGILFTRTIAVVALTVHTSPLPPTMVAGRPQAKTRESDALAANAVAAIMVFTRVRRTLPVRFQSRAATSGSPTADSLSIGTDVFLFLPDSGKRAKPSQVREESGPGEDNDNCADATADHRDDR